MLIIFFKEKVKVINSVVIMNKVHDIDKLTVDQILVAMEIKKNVNLKHIIY